MKRIAFVLLLVAGCNSSKIEKPTPEQLAAYQTIVDMQPELRQQQRLLDTLPDSSDKVIQSNRVQRMLDENEALIRKFEFKYKNNH